MKLLELPPCLLSAADKLAVVVFADCSCPREADVGACVQPDGA